MFGQFNAPYPVHSLDTFVERRPHAEFLVDIFRQLDTPDSKEMHSYGLHLDLEKDGVSFTSRPYCWCDGENCPWCSGEFDIHDIQASRHELIEVIEPKWRKTGFIEGHGAPNLWVRSEDFDIRIWWYKYIGRGSDIMLSDGLTWKDVERILTDFVRSVAPLSHKRRKAESIADAIGQNLNGETYEALVETLMSAPIAPVLDDLVERVTSAGLLSHQMKRASELVSKHTRLPENNREGTPLSLDWRLKKLFEDPKRNLK